MAFFSLQTPVVDNGAHLKNGATSAGFIKFFENSGNGSNSVTLIGPASTGDVTLTLPASTDTLVGKATTDTLTNKTLTTPTINGAALTGSLSGTPTFTGDTITFSSTNASDPLLVIKNTTNDANGARLQFVKDKGAAGVDGDDIGVIEFVGDDSAQAQTTFAKILAEVSEADDSDEAGKLSLFVAESDGTTTQLTAGLILEGEHATDGQVDVTIAAGSASTTTVNGNLTVTSDLTVNGDSTTFTSANANDPLVIIKNTTNDTDGARLRFVKDKGAAGAANDVCGLIEFYGDDANQDNILFSEIKSQVAVHTNGQEGGKLTLSVASHDGESQPGLIITDGSAEDEVDVTIGNGTDSVTTISGDITITGCITQGGDAAGDMYYRNASGVLARFAIGSSNKVLKSNGSEPVWASGVLANGNNSFNGDQTFSDDSNIIYSPKTITIADGDSTGSANLSFFHSAVIFIDMNDTTTSDEFVRVVKDKLGGTSYTAGQTVNIFFDTAGASLKLDFTADGLCSGSGDARYLIFSTTGQSASLVYVNSKWCVLNTGAAVE